MNDTHQKTFQAYFRDLVGIPYEILNCWDLTQRFYNLVLGQELETYFSGGKVPPRNEVKNLIYTNLGDFEKVSEPIFGDIVILTIYGIESHIGVFVGDGQFLHTTKLTGSVIERVSKWQRNIVGFYRVKAKKDD